MRGNEMEENEGMIALFVSKKKNYRLQSDNLISIN